MAIWKFSVQGREVRYGDKSRRQLTADGCNEPYKDRYWCPKRMWFRTSPCPFVNRNECENYELMCGGL
ncbi:MAG: hypothetical protein A2511_09270 [Deltaproteobacteria bacterium RIFOXYD12_FULL_50_9]|nr:MAG: hypothetical protein A2511_09270 [Deltaproteobacteria bacterium RIFOXYD12_FULL_50_9]